MEWDRLLAYITGTVDQELLLRNEYLAAENRILRAQIKGRPLLSEAEKARLADIGHRLGRKALAEVAATANPDTILGSVSQAGCQQVRRVKVPSSVGAAARGRSDRSLGGANGEGESHLGL